MSPLILPEPAIYDTDDEQSGPHPMADPLIYYNLGSNSGVKYSYVEIIFIVSNMFFSAGKYSWQKDIKKQHAWIGAKPLLAQLPR